MTGPAIRRIMLTLGMAAGLAAAGATSAAGTAANDDIGIQLLCDSGVDGSNAWASCDDGRMIGHDRVRVMYTCTGDSTTRYGPWVPADGSAISRGGCPPAQGIDEYRISIDVMPDPL